MLRPLPFQHGRRFRSLTPVTLMPAPLMPRSTLSAWTMCVHTFTEPMMAGKPGPRSFTESPMAKRSTSSGKIPVEKDYCSPEPSAPFTSRLMTAITGSRCDSTCRRHRCEISSLRTMTWRLRPTAAAFGFLITLLRCGSGTGISVRRSYSNLKPHFACAGVLTPILRCHRMSLPAKIRLMAQ